MALNIGSAAAAYARQARSAGFGPMEARSNDPGKSFVDMLGQAVSNAIDTGRHSETMSARAIAGKADIGEVVSAAPTMLPDSFTSIPKEARPAKTLLASSMSRPVRRPTRPATLRCRT